MPVITMDDTDGISFTASPQTIIIKDGVLVYRYNGEIDVAAVSDDFNATRLFNYGHIIGDGVAIGVTLGNTSGAYVYNAAGADITGDVGVFVANGGGGRIDNAGSITGISNAVVLYGARLDNSGRIDGNILAYGLSGFSSSVKNSGSIDGDLLIRCYGNSTGMTLSNFGEMHGDISIDGYESAYTKILNRGSISGGVSGGITTDVIDNRGGHITGDVSLGGGDDTLDNRGGRIDGVIYGGAGNDTFIIDAAPVSIVEIDGGGRDTIEAAVMSLDLADYAFIEDVTLLGGRNLNATGDAGANTLRGNAGRNILTGLAGDDTYYVQNTTDQVIEAANGGSDTVVSKVSWTLSANVENLVLDGTDFIDGTGNADANKITGNNGNNVLMGGAGADKLVGGGGIDTASYANAGAAVTASLASPESNTGDAAGDTYVGIQNLLGSGFADTLTGDNGDNFIDGGAGADTMSGGKGRDGYRVDNTADKVVEAYNSGEIDTVFSTVGSYTLGAYVEDLYLDGSGAINGVGNSLANNIYGNTARNIINGQAGNDHLYGNGGGDTYVFRAAFGQDFVGGFVAGSAAGHDTIQFDKTAFADFAAVMSSATETNNAGHFTTLITSGSNSVALDGIQKSTLTSADFTFV